jgi:hypothetical protein
MSDNDSQVPMPQYDALTKRLTEHVAFLHEYKDPHDLTERMFMKHHYVCLKTMEYVKYAASMGDESAKEVLQEAERICATDPA